MGLLDKLLIGGAVALAGYGVRIITKDAKEAAAAAEEEKRRRETPPRWIPWLTEQDFRAMVDYVVSQTPRIADVKVRDLVVTIFIRSHSGLSTWSAELDFNDYGNPSGKCWISTENGQSPIPKWFAKTMRGEMTGRLEQGGVRFD